MGKFQVTQEYKGEVHGGLDLVGLELKEIHSTVDGCVVFAGWENPDDVKQGFGQYVVIRAADGLLYHYGHLSVIKVKQGDNVKCTDVIGIEGTTGYSTGSHCHYEIRKTMSRGSDVNVSEISGIPNKLGIYTDGYKEKLAASQMKVINAILEIDGHKYSGTLTEYI